MVALAGHRRQGVHPAEARPAHVRDDRRHPDHPAHAVRLRDQLRSRSTCRPRVLAADHSEFSRSILGGADEQRLLRLRRRGCTTKPRRTGCSRPATRSSSSRFPPDFSRALRARRAAGAAGRGRRDRSGGDRQRDRGASNQLAQRALAHDLAGPLAPLAASPGAVRGARCTARYNPEAITQYNIVPGLMGVILTMTMVMMTGLAITRERERGTMENLLATPRDAARGDDRQDRALHADRARSRCRIILLAGARACSTCRCWAASPSLYLAVLLFIARQPDARPHVLVARAQPAAGDADDVLLLPAVDPAVGLHVSVPRHAAAGRRRSARCCRSRISCASCAASCSRATASPRSRPRRGRSPLFMLVVIADRACASFRSTLD